MHTTKIRFLGPLYCSCHVPKNIENNWIGMDRVNNSVMYPARHKSNSAFNLSRRRMKVAKRYLVEQLLLAFVVKILSATRCICGQSGNRKARQLLPFPRIFSLCIKNPNLNSTTKQRGVGLWWGET